MPTPLPAVAPSSCWCCLSRRSLPFLLRFLLLLYIGRQPAQDCFGGCGTAATNTGNTGTAPTGGFDPTLLKDFGIFKQIGGGGTRRVTDPWRLSCIIVCLWGIARPVVNRNTICVGRLRSYWRETAWAAACGTDVW